MKNTLCLCCLCLCLTLLTGCLTTPSTPYQALNPSEDKALVYVYRPESVWFRGTPFIVYAGNDKHAPLINNGYFPLQLDPGNLFFRLTRQATLFAEEKVDAIEMTVEKGKIYYLRIDPQPYGAFKFIIMPNDVGEKEAGETVLFQQQK